VKPPLFFFCESRKIFIVSPLSGSQIPVAGFRFIVFQLATGNMSFAFSFRIPNSAFRISVHRII